jgi:GNAT superfamily N-acetyltransferase
MVDWRIEPLERSRHDRSQFSCGKAALDDFLRQLVSQYEKRKLGKTFVAVRPDDLRVLGYYTLASSSVSFEHVPAKAKKKLPKHPIPVALLARLAVDQSMQGKGLGKALLMDALMRVVELEKNIGIHAVEVDAIDTEAEAFYVKYGFAPLQDQPRRLYLPLATIKAT